MDSLSLVKGDGRAVNWSHPMNNSTQLPPKSPGAYSMFGSTASLFESSGGFNLHSSLPVRGGNHKRTPSAGYLPNVQPTWLEEILESPDGDVVVKKGSHRRSSSDSVAFLDSPHDFTNFVENVTEEDEFVLREPPPPVSRPTHHRRGVSADFESSQYDIPAPRRPTHRRGMSADYNNNRLDKEQLLSVLSELEPFQKRQPKHGVENLASRGPVASNLVRPGSSGDSWHTEKGRKHVTLAVPSSTYEHSGHDRGRNQKSSVSTPENRSTASDSNSHSDDSNDELRSGNNGRHRSEPEVQSRGEGDGSRQLQGDGSEQLDPSLDPKKAKRILANRQSAQRSRVRKLQYISELERSVNALQTEVTTLSPQVGFYDHRRALLTAENVLLKQKLAALAQTQRFKEAHNEALKKEVARLLQLFNQQNQPQQHIHVAQHRPLSPKTYDLQQQQFSKLDLGPSIPKPKSPDVHASGAGTKISSGLPSPLYATAAVPPSIRNGNNVIRPPSHAGKTVVASSCMVPNSGKNLEGRMMGGTGTLPSDFMVHNS